METEMEIGPGYATMVDMCEDDSSIFNLFIKSSAITNTSVQISMFEFRLLNMYRSDSRN